MQVAPVAPLVPAGPAPAAPMPQPSPLVAPATPVAAPPPTATAPAGAASGQPGTSVAAAPAPGQHHQRSASHKSTTLIPSWSRALSSQALQTECQKVHQPLRTASSRDVFAVLELEVMKYVAYCGGITVKFRVDDLLFGPVENVTWGLASTRACMALLPPASGASVDGASTSASAGQGTAAAPAAVAPVAGSPGGGGARSPDPKARAGGKAGTPPAPASPAKQPTAVPVPVDSVSRKPLYMISSTSTHRTVCVGDVLTIDLAPREDKQPVITATLKLNDTVLLQSSLPCSIISSLQMHPFVTALSGMSLSLHEAVTPSPLFTWYAAVPNGAPETQLCELDTCIKYHTAATTPALLGPHGCGNSVEFLGSTTFTGGRQRWTVQLDNYSAHPTHIFVGIATSALDAPASSNNSNILASFAGPLRSLSAGAGGAGLAPGAGPSTSQAAAASPAALALPGASAGPSASAGAGVPASPGAGTAAADVVASRPHQGKWGAWIKLPGELGWGGGRAGVGWGGNALGLVGGRAIGAA